MASAEFFDASQQGDAGKLRDLVQSTNELDINAKDSQGMTALGYGARNGHVEVVQELLSQGADKDSVLQHGYGMANAEIAPLFGQDMPRQLSNGHHEEGVGMQQMQAGPIDVHGGRQLPDGTISYMAASDYAQGYPMPAHMAPQYYDGSMPPPSFVPNGAPHHPSGHSRQDSSVNLPPPEIARMIPCKYFPNCRYGDQCVFAHPVSMSALPPMPPQQGHPLSPPLSPPAAMQPIFYQQMPPGYPYPPYGAAPHQHYMPMAPPMGQYGLPPPFAPGMLPPQPQQLPHEQQASAPSMAASASQSPAQGEAAQTTSAANVGDHDAAGSSSAPVPSQPTQAAEQAEQAQSGSNGMPSQEAAAEPASTSAVADTAAQVTEEASTKDASAQPDAKPVHRRQSFNSFLQHHAVPFQPQTGEMLAGYAPRGMAMAPMKGRRSGFGMPGSNGMAGKKGGHSNERPPCTFFALGKCRFGQECRFPHILPDGTDARPLAAQQRPVYTPPYGQANGLPASRPAAVNGNASSSSAPANGNFSAPASAPTGPQADKKAQQQQKVEQQQGKADQQQSKPQPTQIDQSSQRLSASQPNGHQTAAPSAANGHAKGSAAMQQTGSQRGDQGNVVRSNPSKTSSQAAAAAAAAAPRGKKNKHDRANNQQQQQQQSAANASHQRVPTVNDFPALSPGLNAHASASPQNGTSTAAPVAESSAAPAESAPSAPAATPEARSAPNGSSATAPRVNFSAILSAPAPPKAKPSPQPSSAALAPAAAAESDGKSDENTAPVPVAAEEVNAKPLTAAAALAAAPNGTATPKANGVTAAAPQQQPASNGRTAPQKQRGGPRESNGSANSAKGGSQNGTHRQAPNGAPTKAINGHVNGNAGSDDDFQLVNRSRSSHKRAPQNHANGAATNNGNGAAKSTDGIVAQAKTVTA